VATWLPSLVAVVGGWRQYWIILRSYSYAQFAGTSLLFGAPPVAALHMAWQALVWSCLGVLSWAWAVPFLITKSSRGSNPAVLPLLAWWFFPGLLFYAIVHVGDPDQTLSIVPATCVAGAVVLTNLTRRASRAKTALVISICVLLNFGLFVKPINKAVAASTIKPVRWTDRYMSNLIDGVRLIKSGGPITVVLEDGAGVWRHLTYYAPQAHVVVIERGNGRPVTSRHYVGTRTATRALSGGTVALPACGTLAWADTTYRPVANGGVALNSYRSLIYFTQARAGGSFDFRDVHFVAGGEPCSGESP
jgi:hypothetical protein